MENSWPKFAIILNDTEIKLSNISETNIKKEVRDQLYLFRTVIIIWLLAHPVVISAEEEDRVELDTLTVIETAQPPQIFFDQPNSVTVLRRQEIEERGFTEVQDVVDTVPNLNIMDSGQGSFLDVVGIRGLINTPFFSGPSTLIYVDDVPYGGTFSYANQIFGIDSVEVFRGPQGALFGKNSYAGVINVTSRQPSEEPHWSIIHHRRE